MRERRPSQTAATEFVPVAITLDSTGAEAVKRHRCEGGGIELRIGDAEMWIGPGVDPQAISAAVFAAIRALKAPS